MSAAATWKSSSKSISFGMSQPGVDPGSMRRNIVRSSRPISADRVTYRQYLSPSRVRQAKNTPGSSTFGADVPTHCTNAEPIPQGSNLRRSTSPSVNALSNRDRNSSPKKDAEAESESTRLESPLTRRSVNSFKSAYILLSIGADAITGVSIPKVAFATPIFALIRDSSPNIRSRSPSSGRRVYR